MNTITCIIVALIIGYYAGWVRFVYLPKARALKIERIKSKVQEPASGTVWWEGLLN